MFDSEVVSFIMVGAVVLVVLWVAWCILPPDAGEG